VGTVLTQIAALVTISAAATYVLGLIALCWPIYQRVTNDISTALYTVSLVPRTVVAGQGLIIFVSYPLITALFIIAIVSVPLLVPELINTALVSLGVTEMSRGGIWDQIILALVSATLALLFFYFLGRPRGFSRFLFPPPARPGAPSFGWKSTVISSIGGAIGAWWILSSLAPSINEGRFSMDGVTFLTVLIVVFTINAVVSAPQAVSIDPPFPRTSVQVRENDDGTDSTQEEPQAYEGKLIAHVEGHWYFFDELSNNLMAVPDDKADVVCAPRQA
jgi:hypothetical protein